MSELLDPRLVLEGILDQGLPPWKLIENLRHVYVYDGEPVARLRSLRMNSVRTAIGMPNLCFEEDYQIETSPGRDHGQHWHQYKIELMTVVRGKFSFSVTNPIDGRHETLRFEAMNNAGLFVFPGVMHRVTALTADSMLRVYSTTEHDENAPPDAFRHWVNDLR